MTDRHHEIKPIASHNDIDFDVHNHLHSEAYSRSSSNSSVKVGDTTATSQQDQVMNGNNVNVEGANTTVKYPRNAPDMAPMFGDESRSTGFQVTTPIGGIGVFGESERYRDLQDARTTCDVATNTMAANVEVLARYGFQSEARQLANMTVSSSDKCAKAIDRLPINGQPGN